MNLVKFFMSDVHACGHIRGEVPAREINKSFSNWHVNCKSDVMFSDYYKTNLMVYQRQWKPEFLLRMRAAQARFRVKCVVDWDDDMLSMPPEFRESYEHYSKPEVREGLVNFIREADAVTVSTAKLAEVLAARTPKPIHVVPNYVDMEMWEGAYAQRMVQLPKKEKVTIGWMASGSHMMDAPLVEDALVTALDEDPRVELFFVGWIGFECFRTGRMEKYKDRVKCFNWVDINALPNVMANFDIGICPIQNIPFNLCKSGIKHMQYASLAIPSISSPLDPYNNGVVLHGDNGYLAHQNSPKGWTDALMALVKDDALRLKIGALARADALRRFDIRNGAVEWTKAWDRILHS